MGLYGDSGLIIIRNPNGPKLDSYRKRISNTLKLLGFKITINTNLKIVNFLDVTLNIRKGTFEVYKKEDDTPSYIHTSSNKYQNQLDLSDYSSNINIFNKNKQIYDNAQKFAVINKH